MKKTRIIMGMPVTVEVKEKQAVEKIFQYFKNVDERFSVFKTRSEITKINNGEIEKKDWSADMKIVFDLSEKTKQETDGYFDIVDNNGKYNPSGLVKGWAIYNAADLLKRMGFKDFYVEAGGDIQVSGKNSEGKPWKIGIRNPFNKKEIVKVVHLENNEGIATSGTYERGAHIYNPKDRKQELADVISITVIGPNIYEADRFATAAFAMQKRGINFIENLQGFEGYMIDKNGKATMTSGFERYL